MRDLIARLRSLLTTGLPIEDLYTISAYARPAPGETVGRSIYVETVRGYKAAHARAFVLNGTVRTTTYSYVVTRRPA